METNMSNNEKTIQKILNEQNSENRRVDLTLPAETVEQLVRHPFEKTSPLQLKRLEESEYQQIPVLNSVRCLAQIIEQQGELKATRKGCLPRDVVADLHRRAFFPKTSSYNIADFRKVLHEGDVLTVSLTRILLELAEIIHKKHGKLMLTDKWAAVKQDNETLLRLIFESFTQKLQWSLLDQFPSERVGQHGFAVSLAMADRFGAQPLNADMCAEAYYNFFPFLREDFLNSSLGPAEKSAPRCYSLRTFERFLAYFGLVKVYRSEKDYCGAVEIKKTKLFNKFIAMNLKDV